MVKPGCRSSVRYLYQLLQQKHEEHMKQIIKHKKTKYSHSQSTNSDSLSISQDSRQDISISITTDLNTTTSGKLSIHLVFYRHYKMTIFEQFVMKESSWNLNTISISIQRINLNIMRLSYEH